MKKKFLLLIFFILCIVSVYSYEKKFINPLNGNVVIYKGDEHHGNGKYYLIEDDKEVLIIEAKCYYGPQVYWHGNNIIEIYIPFGSPFNGSYIYNSRTKSISSFIENVLMVFPNDDVLVCSDGFEKIIFMNINTQKILQEIKIDGITGAYLSIRTAFDIKLKTDIIMIGLYFDPKSLKEFKTIKYYSFKKEF
ncbi:hypothetical protein E4O03_04715 [Treponema sp. OMZ 792]|uniref:hypothetical protein n=1 Tax=unclassified Treponema TaxID=2638727 RepID=UPI0020A4CDF7|nr:MULTISPECIES: hypothetical protein [unclassified Treponema]UTC76014.1 hypothetical protein E4O03_04715 [Treponema sp. OMZ 792]UTC80016.1 hypothetical protein E4O07_04735 [Treponema sp. OMZ 798]